MFSVGPDRISGAGRFLKYYIVRVRATRTYDWLVQILKLKQPHL